MARRSLARDARREGALAVALAVVLVLAGCSGGGHEKRAARPPSGTVADRSASTPTSVVRPRGGSVRVGVRGEPDPGAPTLAGAAVRSLVLPQLFVAEPDGSWSPSLVEPGSDHLSADGRVASFRLRAGAVWSDGSPLTADDLRRSADTRFVSAVSSTPSGEVEVRLAQALPGWRRLWSGTDSIAAPKPGVWGGPFVVASRTPGLETVLRRNDRWWGAPAPWLDEVHLVVVSDAVTERLLLARRELDVVAPLAATNRLPQFRGIPGVRVDATGAVDGGWWFGLLVNRDKVGGDEAGGLVGTVDARRYRDVLLRGETASPSNLPEPGGDAGALKGDTITLTGTTEDPMTALLERAMQKRARAAGGTLELRNAETDRVEGWLRSGDYDAALVWSWDPPGGCWVCRWGGVDAALAASADAGDEGAAGGVLEKVAQDHRAFGLWRPVPAVASRAGVEGVRANGFGLSAAWNAWEWWREVT